MKSNEPELVTSRFSPRNPRRLRARRPPRLTIAQILAWADSHFERTHTWPRADSGWVFENKNEHWRRIDAALRQGLRGLNAASSLAKLLNKKRGVRNRGALPALSESQIVAGAKAHYQRTGKFPTEDSGPVSGVQDEVWGSIDGALRYGSRGLPGGDSLPRLLARHFRTKVLPDHRPLTINDILSWADEHFARTGRWPKRRSGAIAAAPAHNWGGVESALRGSRVTGLRSPCTLAQLLAQCRGARNRIFPPRLSARKILAWADAYFTATGNWPRADTGTLTAVPGERWSAIDRSLRVGRRGLPGGSSLVQLLARRRRVPIRRRTRLSYRQILEWADLHFERSGRWPNVKSGVVADTPGENWSNIDALLRKGFRGLRGGGSLAQLLEKCRGVRNRRRPKPGKTKRAALLLRQESRR